MNIGNLKLKNPYFLAPMAEVNDIAFRLLCKKAGCSLTYTGMINPLTQKSLALNDKPAIQLFCTNTKGISECIKKYESKASLFDFNLGCPAKTARKLGFGAFLQPKTRIIENILKIMRKSTKKPITIKIRKSKHTKKIVKIAEKYCDAICIHPRTLEQGYGGFPDLKFAEQIKSLVSIPVIYSGNVTEFTAPKLLETFDFIMIGREAMGDPNIFSRLQNKKSDYNFFDWLKLAKKYKLYFSQIKFQAMKFTRGFPHATESREQLVYAKTEKQIISIMDKLKE